MMETIRKLFVRGLVGRLHRSESGTSMTEFAITLPVYFLFVLGILNVYEIQQGVLLSEQRASANLWEDAIDYQTGGHRAEMVPGVGAATAGSYYSDVGESFSVAGGLDVVTAATGMYADSGAKTMAADIIPTIDVEPEPEVQLSQVMCSPSFGHNLMNDMVNAQDMSFDNFYSIASAILSVTGTRPGLAAGIRYGTVSGIDESSFGSDDERRGYQADTQTHYVASAPTMPTSRLGAVVLSRVEIGTDDSFRDTIAFGGSNIGSGSDGIGSCP